MEVKPGYKHTEAGVIPEDWDSLKLGNFISLQRGHDLTWRDRRAGSVPVIGSAGQNGFHDVAIVKGPGVVLGRSGASFGEAHYCETDFWPHNTALYVTDFKDNDPLFVFYFLKAFDFTRHNSGGAQQSLNRNFIAPIPIGVPRPPEQRAIAEALSDVDRLLGRLDRLITKKRELKQAAMQQLLTGQTRLPSFHGEWDVIRFTELADKTKPWSIVGGPFGSNLKASDYTGEGVRIIQLQNIGDGQFLGEYAIYTSEAKADELLSNNIYPGEIILSKMGDPVARACLVPSTDRRYLMASDGIRLAVDPQQFNTHFVLEYINSPYFRPKAIEASTGSTRQRIKLEDLKRLPFVKPTLPEQNAIAAVLSDIDAGLFALEQRREKTRTLKQAMIQELLTGKTRLVAAGGSHARTTSP